MKTNEQIKKWINSHDWAAQYYYNATKGRNFSANILKTVLDHELERSTISAAFGWASTPEGYNFWSKINDEFRAWYREPEKIVVNDRTDSEILYNLLRVVAIQHGITRIRAGKDDKEYVFEA